MTQDEFVSELINESKQRLEQYWKTLPDEHRLRLAAMEKEIHSIARRFEHGMWEFACDSLDRLAIEQEGKCECGRRRERRKKSLTLSVLGQQTTFPVTYLYCRACRQGICPVRKWLGLESGGVSLGLERALTDLTTRMTFGDAVDSMAEHHDQHIDRTKAERITYSVGQHAEEYLQYRRTEALEKNKDLEIEHVDQLFFTADGGAIPLGEFSRPAASTACKGSPRTEVRNLLKGTRTIVGREARLISVHDVQPHSDRVVDCHIAPYGDTDYTGERMFAAAAEAGLGDGSKIHGVFDMGKWIHAQFEKQFFVYDHSACADIIHVTEYLIDAGRVLAGRMQAKAWGMERKRQLLEGEFNTVLAELAEHQCQSGCLTSESGKCLVRTAHTYLENNAAYMSNYKEIRDRDLPIGSGEAESGIRHIIKRRMDVAGAWDALNAPLMLSLLAIRACGWWDEFWKWRDEQDQRAWRNRQEGTSKVLFRGMRGKATTSKAA